MDILTIVYTILLFTFLVAPFLILFRRFRLGEHLIQTSIHDDLIKKRYILLENLKDLKLEFDSKKYSQNEFDSVSQEIISELTKLDSEIDHFTHNETKELCPNCQSVLSSKAR